MRLMWSFAGVLLWLCVSELSPVTSAFTQSLDSDFTFTLPPGHKECFYQSMKKDASLEIEYQVNTFSFFCLLIECSFITCGRTPWAHSVRHPAGSGVISGVAKDKRGVSVLSDMGWQKAPLGGQRF